MKYTCLIFPFFSPTFTQGVNPAAWVKRAEKQRATSACSSFSTVKSVFPEKVK